MNMKYAPKDKAVIPDSNQIAFDFLKQNGCSSSETKGRRMNPGNDINCQPNKIISSWRRLSLNIEHLK